MAKKKKKRGQGQKQKSQKTVTYNKYKPNRQARRLGITAAEEQEEPKKETKAAVLGRKVQQARETQKRIVPPGLSYGQYMEYLKKKRQELEEKKQNLQ